MSVRINLARGPHRFGVLQPGAGKCRGVCGQASQREADHGRGREKYLSHVFLPKFFRLSVFKYHRNCQLSTTFSCQFGDGGSDTSIITSAASNRSCCRVYGCDYGSRETGGIRCNKDCCRFRRTRISKIKSGFFGEKIADGAAGFFSCGPGEVRDGRGQVSLTKSGLSDR